MAEVIKVRNELAQHIGVVNSAPCPEMNIVAKEITENGRYEARTEGVTGFDPVIVNVPSREEIGYENGYAAGYDEGYDKGYEVAGEYSVTEEDLTFSGDIQYLFYKGRWTQLIDKFGSLMNFNNVTGDSVFYQCETVKDLSKLKMNFDGSDMYYQFYWCRVLEKLPKATGSISEKMDGVFIGDHMITSDEINKFFIGLSYKASRSSMLGTSSIFSNCYSIRNLGPFLDWMDKHLNSYAGTSANIFNYGTAFNTCVSLDEITNLPVIRPDLTKTSNAFSNTFADCNRLKNLMFKTDNGTPYKANWKSQTIDLTQRVGYNNNSVTNDYVINYNSGITSDKRVRNASTYESLKNDPDWYTTTETYSRYNHDSAVNTINSLPDTSEYLASAGGTNTIKFKGASGSKTDGGAINTLTAEEIAVATAKGWTVTLS